MKKYMLFGIFLVSFSITLFIYMFLNMESKETSKTNTSDTVTQLDDVEIQEYQGENLSSLSELHNNAIKGTQYIDKETYQLKINGLVDNELSLGYNEVLDLPKYEKVVTLYCVEGWDATILWEGVLLKDIFRKASVQSAANTIIFKAADDYSTSLPLDYILDNDILFAYKLNGVVLPPEKGFPFQVVAEQKWGYKWIKWVTEIELSNDENYKGYWERAGYSNKGDINGPKFDD